VEIPYILNFSPIAYIIRLNPELVNSFGQVDS